jgi:hypothetical protein
MICSVASGRASIRSARNTGGSGNAARLSCVAGTHLNSSRFLPSVISWTIPPSVKTETLRAGPSGNTSRSRARRGLRSGRSFPPGTPAARQLCLDAELFLHFPTKRCPAVFAKFRGAAGNGPERLVHGAVDQQVTVAQGKPRNPGVEPPPSSLKRIVRRLAAHSSSNRLACVAARSLGGLSPICPQARAVSTRPRGVRCRKPCWMR